MPQISRANCNAQPKRGSMPPNRCALKMATNQQGQPCPADASEAGHQRARRANAIGDAIGA
eukprot:867339-Alexandrium_andersonii.AAC.1